MAKDDTKSNSEHDVEAMRVAVNEVLDALKTLNTEAQLRVLASTCVFLGVKEQLVRRLA